MAEYKGIKGFKVQTVSTDPAASAIAGGTWASGTSLNTARKGMGGFGLQTAAVASGGYTTTSVTNSESYNGTSWTEGNDINNVRFDMAAAGTQTAGIIFSGDPYSAFTETYDGTSYTEVGDLNTARQKPAGFGAQPLAICAGGEGPPGAQAVVESWNGTSWTEVGDLNTARFGLAAAIQAPSTNGIVFGGYITNDSALAETWNGSSWTEVNDLNTSRYYLAGAGTQTDALAFGGSQNPPRVANTEYWDGTNWTEVADLATVRDNLAGAGTTSLGLAFGGNVPPVTNVTEEWSAPALFSKENLGQVFYNSTADAFKVTQQSIPGGTWASGGDLNTARYRFGGASQGTQNAGLVFGSDSPTYGQTEEYNGTAWSEQNDLNTGRYISYGGAGTQTACVTAGGYNPAGSPVFNTVVSETYNGTSWTEGNDLNTGRLDCSTFGSSTAGVLVGGGTGSGGPNTVANVEIYDGTSWSETTDIPTATQEMGSFGTGTAGLIFGGSVDDNPTTKNTTIEWNGTSWTSGGNYPIYIKYTTGFGSLTNGIGAGGNDQTGAISGVCNVYNGTSWSEIAELTTARSGLSGNGTGVAGFVAGGETTVAVTTTEEWTATILNSTLTAS
jgi:hypothetical protein